VGGADSFHCWVFTREEGKFCVGTRADYFRGNKREISKKYLLGASSALLKKVNSIRTRKKDDIDGA
jgi:hypothetical protein